MVAHTRPHGGNVAVDPNPNLYIHNVPKDATEEELKDLFSGFGTVERIRLKVNQKIGPQALYAFVTFSSTAEAQTALQRLNGYDMRSRRLRIEFQRSRGDEDRPHPLGGGPGYNDYYATGPPAHHSSAHDGHRGRSPSSFASRSRDFGSGSRGSGDRRKRGHHQQSYDMNGCGGVDQYGFEYFGESGGHSFKRARQYDVGPASANAYSSSQYTSTENSVPGRGGDRYDAASNKYSSTTAVTWAAPSSGALSAPYHRDQQLKQQPTHMVPPAATPPTGSCITIYLCELLRQLGLAALSRDNKGSGTANYPAASGAPQTGVPHSYATGAPPISLGGGHQEALATGGAINSGGAVLPRQQSPSGAAPTVSSHDALGHIPPSSGQLSPAAVGLQRSSSTSAAAPPVAQQTTSTTGYPSHRPVQTTAASTTPSAKPAWTGSLARNARRKIPVTVFALGGPVEDFLSGETLLNISHRSSWDEVSRKPLTAASYIRLSDTDMEQPDASSSGGAASASLLTAQKRETYQKCFQDHVDYLTSKERAGVVALADGKHLYIVPPGTAVFEQFRTSGIPSDVPVLLGLFANALTLPPQPHGTAGGTASTLATGSSTGVTPSTAQHYAGQQDVLQNSSNSLCAAVPAGTATTSHPFHGQPSPLGANSTSVGGSPGATTSSCYQQQPVDRHHPSHPQHHPHHAAQQPPSTLQSHSGVGSATDSRPQQQRQQRPSMGAFPTEITPSSAQTSAPFLGGRGNTNVGTVPLNGSNIPSTVAGSNQGGATGSDAASYHHSTSPNALINLLSNPHLLATLKASTQQHLQQHPAQQPPSTSSSQQQQQQHQQT